MMSLSKTNFCAGLKTRTMIGETFKDLVLCSSLKISQYLAMHSVVRGFSERIPSQESLPVLNRRDRQIEMITNRPKA